MSIHAYPPRATTELDAVVARAGGVFAWHDGRSIAVNYGSAAGELAACVSAVGVADRSELAKVALEGPPETLEQVVSSLAGAAVAPGGALYTGATWWCGASPERVLVLCEPANRERLVSRIGRLVARHPALRIRDLSDDWDAIAVVGRHAVDVLADLGVYGPDRDPRSVAPVMVHRTGGADALWLLESDHRALVLAARAHGPALWQAINRAGQRFGICAIGHEAIARYALLARAQPEL